MFDVSIREPKKAKEDAMYRELSKARYGDHASGTFKQDHRTTAFTHEISAPSLPQAA